MVTLIGLACAAGIALAGCQSELMSDDRMASAIAGTLGVPESQITLSNRRSDATNTYVTATVQSGAAYACVVNGGGLLAGGMINPPTCNPVRR